MTLRNRYVLLVCIFLFGCANPSQLDLISAVEQNDLPAINRHLSEGVQPDFHAHDDWTPLAIAARNGNTEIAKLLVKHGASVDLPEGGGKTPLFWALKYDHLETARFLVESGADPCVLPHPQSMKLGLEKSPCRR